MKRLLPYTHASAMRLWWNLVALWYISKAKKAYNKQDWFLNEANRLTDLSINTSIRADEWDAVVQHMRGKK